MINNKNRQIRWSYVMKKIGLYGRIDIELKKIGNYFFDFKLSGFVEKEYKPIVEKR